MTTILVMRTQGRILADSRSVWNSRRLNTTRKIVRLPDGSLVTGAGNQQGCFACFEFIRLSLHDPEAIHEVPYVPQQDPCNDNSFTVLHLRNDRTLMLYGDHFQPTPVVDDVYSIGSGDDVVRTALHLGKTPDEAMELACELDWNTGPPIVEERL